ncbi:MAG: hypothetical protein CSA66_04560 [Proteobacteria bacterium]|nr:MAG: hypothetical protein CSA66_04560 [Pseudomonadota bacterium]
MNAPSKRLATVAATAPSAVLMSGCELLPQSGTEWAIAGIIFGVLVVGIVAVSVYASRKQDPPSRD